MMISCKTEPENAFLITKGRVGKLQNTSLVADLESIYSQDSLVRDTSDIKIGSIGRNIKVFEKGGKLLLTLTPSGDSIPRISNIRIHDPRYTTQKGIGLASTFKDIKDNYGIRKIVTSMNNVVIFIQNSDIYYTISKEELPASLRYVGSTNIEAVQIPDKAKIKYVMVGWD
jgi:hypothetical protein